MSLPHLVPQRAVLPLHGHLVSAHTIRRRHVVHPSRGSLPRLRNGTRARHPRACRPACRKPPDTCLEVGCGFGKSVTPGTSQRDCGAFSRGRNRVPGQPALTTRSWRLCGSKPSCMAWAHAVNRMWGCPRARFQPCGAMLDWLGRSDRFAPLCLIGRAQKL